MLPSRLLVTAFCLGLAACGDDGRDAADAGAGNRTPSGPSAPPAESAKAAVAPPAKAGLLGDILGRWAPSSELCATTATLIGPDTVTPPEGPCTIVATSERERVVDMLVFLESQGFDLTLEANCRASGVERARTFTVTLPPAPAPATAAFAVDGGPPVAMTRCP